VAQHGSVGEPSREESVGMEQCMLWSLVERLAGIPTFLREFFFSWRLRWKKLSELFIFNRTVNYMLDLRLNVEARTVLPISK
jgi:hypothetical protein